MARTHRSSAEGRTATRSRIWIAYVIGALFLAVLVAAVAWLLLTRTGAQPSAASKLADYRPAWESAMAKAGVRASFPAGSVDLSKVKAVGSHPFSATFTGKEVSSLLAVYRYRSRTLGDVDLNDVAVTFPVKGAAALAGKATIEGNAYQASVQAPVSYANGKLVVDSAQADLRIEGFSIGGQRKTAALGTLTEYLNSMIDASPGLTIESAEIIEGGVRVSGLAPDQLGHPAPLPESQAGALARRPN